MSLTQNLTELENNVELFLQLTNDKKIELSERMRQLRHMVFWLEYHDKVITSLSNNQKPDVLKGTYTQVNRQGDKLYQIFTYDELVRKTHKALKSVKNRISLIHKDTVIPYKKGVKGYIRDEYIGVMAYHYDMHIRSLKKSTL